MESSCLAQVEKYKMHWILILLRHFNMFQSTAILVSALASLAIAQLPVQNFYLSNQVLS